MDPSDLAQRAKQAVAAWKQHQIVKRTVLSSDEGTVCLTEYGDGRLTAYLFTSGRIHC